MMAMRSEQAAMSGDSDSDNSGSSGPQRLTIDLSILKPGYRPIHGKADELVERLDDGNSGFGAVWKGRNPRLQRTVVFKFCKDPLDDGSLKTLHNELRLVRELDHPGIVRLADECLDAPIPFLIYEYIEGIDLSKWLNQRFARGEDNPIKPNEAAGVILKIAEIISHAHNRPKPVVHRDLKPQNILVANHHDLSFLSCVKLVPDLRRADLRVLDFGIGVHCTSATGISSMSGTLGQEFIGFRNPLYASPQQRDGQPADRSDDVYALGVIWYQLLAGDIWQQAKPDRGWQYGLLIRGMSHAQISLLESCLKKDRADRIPNAVELVKLILQNYPNIGSIRSYSKVIQKHLSGEKEIDLSNVEVLTVKAAKALAGWKGCFIELDGLKKLSPKAASALAEWEGSELNLNGLSRMSPETAEALAEWKGCGLHLNGLTRMTSDVAKALAGWKGRELYFNGLTRLRPEAAIALADWKGSRNTLCMNGLTRLSPETAKALAKWKGDGSYLYLNGLTCLSSESATELAGWKGSELYLNGLTCLSPKAAKALAEWKGNNLILHLDGLTKISPEIAKSLAEWKGDHNKIYLNGLSSLSPETAKALAEWEGRYLCLNGLISLLPETANELATWKGYHIELESSIFLSPDLIFFAAEKGGRALIVELGPRKADVNQTNRDSLTPLHIAVKHGQYEVADLLINWGADHSLTTPDNKETALHLAAAAGNAKIVERLLKAGADPLAVNARGETPLHCAVESGDIATIRLLVPKK